MAKKNRKQKREPTIQEVFAKLQREAEKVWLYPSDSFNLHVDGAMQWCSYDWKPGEPVGADEFLLGIVAVHKARVKAKKDTLLIRGLEVLFSRRKCLELPTAPEMDHMFTVDVTGNAQEDEKRCKTVSLQYAMQWYTDAVRGIGAALNEKEQQS